MVENGIKHGISSIAKGGTLSINVSGDDNNLFIEILNVGKYAPNGTESGIGLNNSYKRLDILYGEKANLTIANNDGMVETKVTIPKETQHQNEIV